MLQERDTGEWSGDSSEDVEDRLCMRADWTHQCLSVASTWNECLKDISSSPGTGEAHEINCKDEETMQVVGVCSWAPFYSLLGICPLCPGHFALLIIMQACQVGAGLILISPPAASMDLG